MDGWMQRWKEGGWMGVAGGLMVKTTKGRTGVYNLSEEITM